MEDDYASEKLKFVSNLNGTTLNEIFTLLTLFPLINFLSVLVKILVLFYVNVDFIQRLNSTKTNHFKYFCKSFLIDYLFCLIPLVLVCTVFSEWKIWCQMLLMTAILLLHKKTVSVLRKLQFPLAYFNATSIGVVQEEMVSFDSIEEEILRLSIKSCRLWLYMLTAVGILGVDFKIFPRENAKTENFGISAMDLGVGFYIVCHSMKIIRNSDINTSVPDTFWTELAKLPNDFYKTLKSSSFLVVIGLARLWSVKATNYIEHVTEYGVHWNFLFTIVLVKLLACPLQTLIRQSAFKSFLIGLMMAFYYQFFLTQKNYTAYLLSNSKRETFLDANKEGIFSCCGYLSIYLISQGIFLRLSEILRKKQKKSMKPQYSGIIECICNLVVLLLFFFAILIWSSWEVQNTSRRLCNLSFICYTLFSCIVLLTFYMITILQTAKFFTISAVEESEDKPSEDKSVELSKKSIKEMLIKLRLIFSFAVVIDSKYTGLLLFLVSNLLTGAVNLSINTLNTPDMTALAIMFVYSFASFAIPTLFFYYFNFKKNLNTKKTE